MKAIRFLEPGTALAAVELPDPTPGPGEVVLRVERCGICGSDLEMTSGKGAGIEPGCTLGHEFAGEVVALGAGVRNLQIGSRVTAMPFDGCGVCDRCTAGRPNHCRAFRVHGCGGRGGGYAEYSLAGARHCIELPDSLDFVDGALIEPLAVALHGARMAGALAGKRVLVDWRRRGGPAASVRRGSPLPPPPADARALPSNWVRTHSSPAVTMLPML